MSVKDLIDRMSHFGAKINTKLTGSDTFSQWDTVLRRKVRGLGATAALEGRREDVEDEEVWDIMDLSVLEMIIDSVMASMRTELEGKTATEAYTLLKNRYSWTGVSSYCTVGMKLFALRQLPQQSIQEYITKFDFLRSEYEAAGGKTDITMQMTVFVAGLQQQYNKEAYNELNRQKEDPDMEALRQALIRFASFEKSQKEMSRPAPQAAARSETPRQDPSSSGLSTKYAGPYTGAICERPA
jgi:gag-polypeptide of LTR copia-type